MESDMFSSVLTAGASSERLERFFIFPMRFWLFAVASADCDVTVDVSAEFDYVNAAIDKDEYTLCFERVQDSRYMVRTFTAGFAQASFAPDVFFIAGSDQSVVLKRTLKTRQISASSPDMVVISVDRLLQGVLPESLVYVIALAAVCLASSLMLAPLMLVS